jgi:hypothetical protein
MKNSMKGVDDYLDAIAKTYLLCCALGLNARNCLSKKKSTEERIDNTKKMQ